MMELRKLSLSRSFASIYAPKRAKGGTMYAPDKRREIAVILLTFGLIIIGRLLR
jgi:hypothetical protein